MTDMEAVINYLKSETTTHCVWFIDEEQGSLRVRCLSEVAAVVVASLLRNEYPVKVMLRETFITECEKIDKETNSESQKLY